MQVRLEFKQFCAETEMDIISIECIPEACALVKGRARKRMLPTSSLSTFIRAKLSRKELPMV